MKHKSIFIGAAAAVVVPLALFLRTFSASPLPMPEPYSGTVPTATPPKEMAVYAIVTGVNHRVAAFGYRGGSFFDRREFSMAGTLVKHPKGDLLIDTGFGRNIDEQFHIMPLFFRAITSYSLWQPAAEKLRTAGYEPKSLRAILLTHSHWDHVSGLPDFPGVPVWVTPQEREFIRKSGPMDFCKLFTGIQYEEYGFEGGAYLGFPTSHDVYGDGSIVVVPAPGHTPGSVIIFVTLQNGTRYAFVGDLIYQMEGITLREERSWLVRKMGADWDTAGNRENLLRMIALKERLPELIIVPAHDMRAFDKMAALAQARSESLVRDRGITAKEGISMPTQIENVRSLRENSPVMNRQAAKRPPRPLRRFGLKVNCPSRTRNGDQGNEGRDSGRVAG